MRLNQVDLNLFVVFDTIYAERNLTRAAEVMNVTQPAVSNALSRLRKALNDPLFVRAPGGMVPTPVAENIVGPVREALQMLNACVQEAEVFDPAVAEKEFNFSMNDMAEAQLLPPLLEHLQRHAPNLGVTSYHVNRNDVPKELASGRLDFAIDAPLMDDPNLRHTPVTGAPFVCLVRPNHPAAGTALTLERYLDMGHIHVSSRRSGPGHVDMTLNGLGLARDVQLRVRHYMVALQVVRRTDLALTVQQRVADQADLVVLPLPFDVPRQSWHLYWHKSAHRDRANRWLRDALDGLLEP